MKRTLLTLSLLFLSAGFSFAESIDIKVKGMVCSFCAQGLDKKFRENPAVQDVEVKLKDKLLHLELKEKATLTDEAIETLIKDSGYNVHSIKRK